MEYKVVLAATCWRLSGVDVFSANLQRQLLQRGIQCKILLTEPYWQSQDCLPIPSDVVFETLPVGPMAPWPTRWQRQLEYLEANAPCVYVPNYDWNHSCVVSQLSRDVQPVCIVHSDEDLHYEHARRLSPYWSAVIAVSGFIFDKLSCDDALLSHDLLTTQISYGVSEIKPRTVWRTNEPLRIIYAGRFVQYQKRVFDIVAVAEVLKALQIPVVFTLIGGGDDEDELRRRAQQLICDGLIEIKTRQSHPDVQGELLDHDIVLMCSEFEGLPLALLEAMSAGCVPVVSDIASGIPELVTNGINGFIIPVGDVEGFAGRICDLHCDRTLLQTMSVNAVNRIRSGFLLDRMGQEYLALFDRLWSHPRQRTSGPILPPENLGVAGNYGV